MFEGSGPRNNYVNPLALTSGWATSMLKYCLMHTLHLGVLHHVNGGAVLTLIEHNFLGAFAWLDTSVFGIVAPHFYGFWMPTCSNPSSSAGAATEKLAGHLQILTLRFRSWVRLHSISNPGGYLVDTWHMGQKEYYYPALSTIYFHNHF